MEATTKLTTLAALPLMLLLLVMGVALPADLRSLTIDIMIFSIYAMAFDLLFGISNQLSIGQAMFFGVGAYGVLLPALRMGVGLWAAMLMALTLCLTLALVLGPLAVRLSEAYFVIITIIFGMIFYFLAMSWTWLTGGSDGLTFEVPPITLGFISYSVYDPIANYYFTLTFFIIVYFILKRIMDSPLGMILVSIRESEERTKFLGYDVVRYKLTAYVISAIFTGLSGALYAIRCRYASAEYFSIFISVEPIIWTLIGGAGTLVGPIVGVALLTPIAYYISALWKHYLIIVGLIMVLIFRFSPKGIMGYIVSKIRRW